MLDTVRKKCYGVYGDVIPMCRGSLFQKENSLFPHKSQSRRWCRLVDNRTIEFHKHEATINKQKLQRNITYIPCRITLQCIKIIIKWQELYFINTEQWALYIARNARLKFWSIVRKSKLKWVSIKESIEHLDHFLVQCVNINYFFQKRKAILHLF